MKQDRLLLFPSWLARLSLDITNNVQRYRSFHRFWSKDSLNNKLGKDGSQADKV